MCTPCVLLFYAHFHWSGTFRGGNPTPQIHPKYKSSSEQGSRQKLARTFQKSSGKRGVFGMSGYWVGLWSGFCRNGRFWKWCFCPLPKTGGLRKSVKIAFYPQKQGSLLLKPRKSTKMRKMAGVTQAKPPLAKSTVVATTLWASDSSEEENPPEKNKEFI